MAKKKEKETEVTITEPKIVIKKQPPTKDYPVKNRVNIGGVWKEKGSKIKLTKEGANFFRSKNWI